MRKIFVILVLATQLSGTAFAKNDRNEVDVKEIGVGQAIILDFKGNKAAAHGWRLVESESRGLELLDVSALGWILSNNVEKSLFRSHDTRRFHLVGKSAGEAELVFEHNYRNIRGQFLFRRQTVRVIILPRSAAPARIN